MNKNFKEDLSTILELLSSGKKFAFSKYADGEYAILRNKKITNCDGWTFDPKQDSFYMDALMESYQFADDEYYVGISCPCCRPSKEIRWMRIFVNVDDAHLTYANLFVNSNYPMFVDSFIPEFRNHDVVLVASSDSDISNLPFEVDEFYPISKTAWRDDYSLVNTLLSAEYTNKLFLFCAGPLGNILSHRLWKENKNNVYMDIGSTLSPWLIGANRGYHKGGKTLNKTCRWE